MPMGVVSDDDFATELTRSESKSSPREVAKPSTPSGQVIDINRGRGMGNVGVPESLQKVIGDTAITDGRQEAVELAKNFGISPSSVSAYSAGATSTASYDEKNAELTNNLDKSRQRVIGRARSKMMQALRYITPDKLESSKARDLAGIAKDMSAVIRNMEPEPGAKDPATNGPTFIIMAPQFRDERSYDIIQAKDEF